MFKVNDTVVFPAHGVARVSDVIEKMVGTLSVKFFKLSFVYSDMTMLIPCYGASTSGVRYLSSPKDIDDAVEFLTRLPIKPRSTTEFAPSGWAKRQKEYQLRIQVGKVMDLAGIYRDLMSLSLTKELSFGEKGLLGTVESLLVQEVIESCGRKREDIVAQLREPFQRFAVGGATLVEGRENRLSPNSSPQA